MLPKHSEPLRDLVGVWVRVGRLVSVRARSRLMAEPLGSLASPSLPYWRCCGALPIREQGVNCGRRRAAGGAREDGADRRPPRWFRLLPHAYFMLRQARALREMPMLCRR